MALFQQGRRLEALPLLEEVFQKNQRDEEVLVALAASLIDHAATLTDQQLSARERLRARDLLEKSESTAPLAQNLLQLLRQLPDNGAIRFSENPAAEQAMLAGEAAFSRRDFDAAILNYSKALEIDPANYSAALFIGNTYDKKNELARAAEWYERAIQLGPNIETAYRYYADMLAKEGDMAKSRAMLIHALVAEPYNRIVWREVRAWAAINNTEINSVFVSVPPDAGNGGPSANGQAGQSRSSDVADVWKQYHAVRAQWQKGGKFQKRFPGETEYRHTLAEESEALVAASKAAEKLQDDKKTSELMTNNRGLALLLDLYRAGCLEAYVLFSLGDAGIAKDYSAYRAGNRNKLEEYLAKFVVPAASKIDSATGNVK